MSPGGRAALGLCLGHKGNAQGQCSVFDSVGRVSEGHGWEGSMVERDPCLGGIRGWEGSTAGRDPLLRGIYGWERSMAVGDPWLGEICG